jgi:hypothetical protein
MGSFSRLKHRHFTHHGVTYTFMGISPNGRAMFTDGAGAMLEVADPDTGMPVWPTEAQARDLMAERKLILRSNPWSTTRARSPARRSCRATTSSTPRPNSSPTTKSRSAAIPGTPCAKRRFT